jgi:hypothetical protein
MSDIIKKTAYEWCLEANIRLLKLEEWGDEDSYFKETVDLKTFYNRLHNCTVKPNSQPRKTEMYLDYKMYGLVVNHICGTIHAGIQLAHAIVDYSRNVSGTPLEKIYNKWADEDKTIIILNGGSTNTNHNFLGDINKHYNNLIDNNIFIQPFYERDLGDQLVAICFLVDERVWKKELYKDFIPESLPFSNKNSSEKVLSQLEAKNNKNYEQWLQKIGGVNNAFLRDFLKHLRKA